MYGYVCEDVIYVLGHACPPAVVVNNTKLHFVGRCYTAAAYSRAKEGC